MRGSLGVRIKDSQTDRHVTARVRGLRFRKTAPGGHAWANMTLILPRNTFPDLGPADKVWIYDTRTAATVWEGYAENPGATDGPSGQSWDLSAQGGATLAADESRALAYIDTLLDAWFRDEEGGVAAGATTSQSVDPTGILGGGLLCQFPGGQVVTTGYVAQMAYHAFEAAGLEFGALKVTTDSGKVDAGYLAELAWNGPVPGFGSTSLASGTGITTTVMTDSRWVGDGAGHPPAGVTRLALRLRRTGGATNVADDATYSFFTAISILARRVNRYGASLTGAAGMVSNTYVRADWVAEDLLGRVLTMCDPASAVIDATTYQIDQLAYHDGVTAAALLDELALYEPDHYWGIGASGSGGKHAFWYRAWPTTPRYEISVKDGYSAPGGEVDLCNRIAVYWTDTRGRKQTTVVTATVPALGTRIRDAEPVTLPEGRGSEANAQRIGEQVLTAKANPPKAARATVRRPIMDHLTGSQVMPWEIEPGYLVRVRETGDDLRLTEMEYEDVSCSALLTLGTPVRTIEQMLRGL